MNAVKRRRPSEEDEEALNEKEEALKAAVFGAKDKVLEGLGNEQERHTQESNRLWDMRDIAAPTLGTDSAISSFIRDVAGSTEPQHTSASQENDSDSSQERDTEEKVDKKPPAWEDEDDSNVSVNVANVRRLRKLRKAETEEVLSGKDYQERLRQQYVSA